MKNEEKPHSVVAVCNERMKKGLMKQELLRGNKKNGTFPQKGYLMGGVPNRKGSD